MTTSHRPGGNFHGGGRPTRILVGRPGILVGEKCAACGAEKLAVVPGRPVTCLACGVVESSA